MKKSLREQLVRIIESSGKSVYRIAKESGVDKAQMSRFLSGKSGMTLETMERLAEVVGFEIVPTAPNAKTSKTTDKRRQS